MATVRKRISKNGKISWQIDYRDPDGKRIRISYRKKKEAEAELGKRVSLIGEKRYLDIKKDYTTTFGELTEKYIENFQFQRAFETSKKYYVEKLLSHFGKDTILANIPYAEVETYFNTLRRTPVIGGHERTNAAVNREIGTLRHMLRKGVEWDMIENSPFDRGKALRLKETNERLRFLTEEEIDRLIDACAPWLRHIVIFCIHTGARRKEVLNLKWYQIKNGQIYFEKTKTDNPRQVPISIELHETLERLRGTPKGSVIDMFGRKVEPGKKQEALVFKYQGMKVPNWKVKQDFKSACKRAKIPYGIKTPDGVTFHTLRHTFGSWLAIRKVSLRTIQVLMGHKNISMTMRYAHLNDDVKHEAVNLLNGLTSKNTCHSDVTRAEMTDTTNTQTTENTPIF